MDKSWMNKPRSSDEYMHGLNNFLDFAFGSPNCRDDKILCPCKNCSNRYWFSREDVIDHLIFSGFVRNYTHWVLHGESSFHAPPSMDCEEQHYEGAYSDMQDMLNDFVTSNESLSSTEDPNSEALQFYKLVEANQTELYPGCTSHSKLSFIIRLFHIKCLGRWSIKSFTMLLELLSEVLPEGKTLPKSYYEVKKFISDLGLSYETIDACQNDCMFFWKKDINEPKCLVCGADRWKSTSNNDVGSSTKKTRKVSHKKLRYFPIGPRLQRLFMSSNTATLMRWHAEVRLNDGVLRHPADSPAWKTFDYRHQDFASDPRNVRLGLAADGFNPFRTMNVSHSTWPVVLVPYNLPYWLYMKQPYMLLSLLIPGPSSPGNDIDIYLQPLIQELQDLWNIGIQTYDASSKLNFQMRAALMWTISDFPGYAMLSGWSTKGRLACPSCNKHTHSQWLTHGRKFCYLGHRRFLPMTHVLRRHKRSFDNKQEFRSAPKPLSGSEVLHELHGKQINFGKKSKKDALPYGWKKRSIFFELPYWKDNILRHNLDVMHIEKNVCDNILWTLLNVTGRSKDSVKSRLDMQLLKIRDELHPRRHESGGPVQGRWMYPIERFLSTLKSYVGNKAQPEGSIAEGYLAEECLTFCSRYLQGVETRFNRPIRNEDNNTPEVESVNDEVASLFPKVGRSLGKGEIVTLDDDSLTKAHHYVLTNCKEVSPFIEQHIAELRAQYPRATPRIIQVRHNSTFQSWFAHQIRRDNVTLPIENLADLQHLARSPNNVVRKFSGYIVDGYRFHTKDLETIRKTQNSGVMVTAGTHSFASARDRNPVYSEISYYGVIQEIIELDYWVGKKVVLFKCDWISSGRGLKQDDYGFTLVNFSHRMNGTEPFILASQAQQVFYVADPMDEDWKVVIKTTPRNHCNMTEEEQGVEADDYLQSQTCHVQIVDDLPQEDNVDWIRSGINGDLVDAPIGFPPAEPSHIHETQEENEEEENELADYDY
ncbi:hypothetical protein LINPERHAP1_LOCUS6538 [Linum perenne]